MSNSKIDDLNVNQNILNGYEQILAGLRDMGYDVNDDPNFKGTAMRAAKGFMELARKPAEIDAEVEEMLTKVFPGDSDIDGMVVSRDNFAVGCCPHHLLPVLMRITVGYVPKNRVIGISKLSRICKLLASKPVMQEDLGTQIANVLCTDLDSLGSAVRITGVHCCQALRGIKAHEVQVTTQKLKGIFKTNAQTRAEFLALADAPRANII